MNADQLLQKAKELKEEKIKREMKDLLKGKRKIELEFMVSHIEDEVPKLLRFSWKTLQRLSKPDLKKRCIWIKTKGWTKDV